MLLDSVRFKIIFNIRLVKVSKYKFDKSFYFLYWQMHVISDIRFWATNIYKYKIRNKALERVNLNEEPVA